MDPAAGITTGLHQQKFHKAIKRAKRDSKVLLDGESNEAKRFVIPQSENVTQDDILAQAPISLAAKKVDFQLPDAQFKISFSRNGKFFCIAGSRGTIKTMNIQTQRPGFSLNVKEPILDVQFLHQENYIASAQRWLYIYDNQGTELHCFKRIFQPLALDFLPYHMLIVAATENSNLNYLDFTTGTLVSQIYTRRGRLSLLAHNPTNAVTFLGHDPGIVSLWTPSCSSSSKPVASMLCHPKNGGITALAVHPNGNYLATAGMDKSIRLWDLRQLGASALHEFRIPRNPCSKMTFSESGLLACASDQSVLILPDIVSNPDQEINDYHLKHTFVNSRVSDVEFCPHEDLLGCGRFHGFSTLLVPGASSPGLDGLESNPFESKRARQEREVRSLLHKIDHNLISLTTSVDAVYERGMIEEAEKLEEAVMGPDRSKRKPKKKKKGKKVKMNRTMFEKSAFVGKNNTYKKKRPLSKPTTGSILDRLIPKV